MKTKNEIAEEIAKLKALKPVGQFAALTARRIGWMVAELEEPFDMTAEDEWNELSDDQQEHVLHSRGWKEGTIKDAPSDLWEWGDLVEQVKK